GSTLFPYTTLFRSLRNTFARSAEQITINAARLDEFPEQGEEALVGDALADSLHQKTMMNSIEVAGKVALDYPASGDTLFTTILQLKLHRANRMVYATGRSEAIGSRVEIALPYRLHRHQHGPLHDPVPQARNAERPELTVRFRYIHASCRQRTVRARQ